MINLLKGVPKYLLAKFLCIKTNSKIKNKCDLNFKTTLEGHNVINMNVGISNSKIGYGSYIGENSRLTNTSIGRYCSIAENVKLVVGQHPTNTFVSTHPAFFSTLEQAGFTYVDSNKFKEQKFADVNNRWSIIIGNDVWIGANTTILDGTVIGDGAIIASGAIVKGMIEPYFIYGGIPAKKIGNRFSDEERDFLLGFKWWNKDTLWIKENANLFSDIRKFMDMFSIKANNEGVR